MYWNRAEYYGGEKPKRSYSGKDFNPFNELDMLIGNGYKKVHEVLGDD